MPDRAPLALQLLRAADWFDEALRRRLADDGWPRLTRNQSLVFASIGEPGPRIVDLAAALDVSRQAAHALVHGMAGLGLLALVDDPDDARVRRVTLTRRGERLADDARRHLAEVEAELADRIGDDHVEALGAALARPWGEPPA